MQSQLSTDEGEARPTFAEFVERELDKVMAEEPFDPTAGQAPTVAPSGIWRGQSKVENRNGPPNTPGTGSMPLFVTKLGGWEKWEILGFCAR